MTMMGHGRTLEAIHPAWARVTGVAAGLWRVADEGGRVIGHVRALGDEHGPRFAAERFRASSRSFLRLGEFWSAREALDCLRYSR